MRASRSLGPADWLERLSEGLTPDPSIESLLRRIHAVLGPNGLAPHQTVATAAPAEAAASRLPPSAVRSCQAPRLHRRGGGLLLAGPPGTGKSALAASLGAASGLAVVCLDRLKLLRHDAGGAEAALAAQLRAVLAAPPCVWVWDELDALVPAAAAVCLSLTHTHAAHMQHTCSTHALAHTVFSLPL